MAEFRVVLHDFMGRLRKYVLALDPDAVRKWS